MSAPGVLSTAPTGFAEVTPDGRICVVQGGVFLGAPVSELIGQSAFEIWTAVPYVIGAIRRALVGESVMAEIEIRGAPWELRAIPQRDSAGWVRGVLLISIDRTERERAQDRSRRDVVFLDSLIENLPAMVFVKSAHDLRFVRFNRAGEELLGYQREELIGKNDHDFFPPEEADFFTAKDRDVLSSGHLIEMDEPIHTRTHGIRMLHTKKIPIYDEAGAPLYLLGISEDITEKTQIETARNELDRLQHEVIANVSHEFRTPMTLIRAHVDRLLARDQVSDDERDHLAAIERGGREVLRLVDDLLDVARLEAGKLAAVYADVDLGRLVGDVVRAFEVLAASREIEVVTETPSTRAEVDPVAIQRVISNLLGNALRNTPRGGRVRCTVQRTRERVQLIIADSGPGIPHDQRDRVFERFFQTADPRRAGGAGLGLALVRDLVTLHAGTVTIEDAPEGGAQLVVDLPIRAPAGTAVVGRVQPGPPVIPFSPVSATTRTPRTDGPLVLIVEDHPEFNRMLVEVLGETYRVATAFDGAEGLARAIELVPDLIVADLMMPRMSGEDMIHLIRDNTVVRAIPILVMTAKGDEDLRVRLLRGSVQDYLIKPFAIGELLARLENLLSFKRARDVIQAELASTRDDVTELATELVARTRETRAAVALRDEFLAIASHELRTPLTPLVIAMQTLAELEDAEPKLRRQLVDTAGRQVARFTALVDELLDATQIDAGVLTLDRTEIELGGLVESVIARWAPQLARAACATSIHHPQPVVGRWDQARLEQVITNVISNAAKFGAGAPIEIGVVRTDHRARVTVRDHGIGIAPERQQSIFDRFERGVSARQYGGLGLGLYICRRIVEAHEGSISVASQPNAGSTFTVELPL